MAASERAMEAFGKRKGGDMLEWRQDMMIGIPEIDAHHRELLNLFNKFENTKDDVEFAKLLNEYIEYSAKHFRAEERVLREYGAVNIEEHSAMHEEITKNLAEIFEKFVREGASALPRDKMLSLIRTWFLDHTLQEDLKMRELVVSPTG
ncbi:MAG TPA: hemerythrin domain-containing protein [Telmatospirillum sp.]|nr:hemerythrin domain-containing protein [Telmatospirillum sp.]